MTLRVLGGALLLACSPGFLSAPQRFSLKTATGLSSAETASPNDKCKIGGIVLVVHLATVERLCKNIGEVVVEVASSASRFVFGEREAGRHSTRGSEEIATVQGRVLSTTLYIKPALDILFDHLVR